MRKFNLSVMKDISSFVKLKYEMITSDGGTWHLCKTYPLEARSKWAWRCAADVEHLAKGFPAAEECIRVAKAYRDGLATKEELNAANAAAMLPTPITTGAARAALAADTAARTYALAAIAAANTIYGVRAAAGTADANTIYGVRAAAGTADHRGIVAGDTKWNQYIEWLWEELCEWEMKQ
jgi:hypothetical protein